jgi:hypothetical protein
MLCRSDNRVAGTSGIRGTQYFGYRVEVRRREDLKHDIVARCSSHTVAAMSDECIRSWSRKGSDRVSRSQDGMVLERKLVRWNEGELSCKRQLFFCIAIFDIINGII